MSAASYNRGTRAIRDQIQREIDASRATKEARAQLWKRALEAGAILSFNAAGGAVVTVGPDIKAIGPAGFAGHRYGGDTRWRGSVECRSAWALALWTVENVGRVRPFRIAV